MVVIREGWGADGVRVGASTFSLCYREPSEPGQIFIFRQIALVALCRWIRGNGQLGDLQFRSKEIVIHLLVWIYKEPLFPSKVSLDINSNEMRVLLK